MQLLLFLALAGALSGSVSGGYIAGSDGIILGGSSGLVVGVRDHLDCGWCDCPRDSRISSQPLFHPGQMNPNSNEPNESPIDITTADGTRAGSAAGRI
jgi:hypothetical protein